MISREVYFDESSCYDFSDSSKLPGWQTLNLEKEEPLEKDVDVGVEQNQENNRDEEQKDSPPRKTRTLREIYDAIEEVASTDHVYFSFFAGEDPVAFDEASHDEKKVHATQEEIKSIEKNNTWEFTFLPSHKSAIGVKWVFNTKTNLDGSINKHKAQLVAKGYRQKEGEDFNEIFAPVSKLDIVRLVISLAVQNGWKIW